MGLGDGGPGTRGGVAVSLAEQPVRLGGEFFGAATGWAARRGPAGWAGLFRAAFLRTQRAPFDALGSPV